LITDTDNFHELACNKTISTQTFPSFASVSHLFVTRLNFKNLARAVDEASWTGCAQRKSLIQNNFNAAISNQFVCGTLAMPNSTNLVKLIQVKVLYPIA